MSRKLWTKIVKLLSKPDRMYITEFYYYDVAGDLRLDVRAALQSEWYSKQVAAMKDIKMQNNRAEIVKEGTRP